jgi:hypothetical protein
MRNQRIAAVHHVVPELKAAEQRIDDALIQMSKLTTAIIEARRDAGLAATFGHDAIEGAGATFGTLMMARRQVVETHGKLDELKSQMGLRTYAGGNLGDKPDQSIEADPPAAALRVVGAA